jgi:hypothetical protein
MYGLFDAAEQVRSTGRIAAAQSSPFMPIRGVRVFVHSDAVERERTKDYWLGFIQMIARQRFNRLNLVFSHQTPFMAPPYPFWLVVEGFEQIRARNLDPAQREHNLDMLRYISQTAADHGIDFTLGLWEHNVQANMKPKVDGITPENIGPYSYAALKAILQACPAIKGVQMRTNVESGIPPDRQVEFYRDWVFRAVRDAGRLVNLEVRGWLMQKGLLEAAKNAGVPLRLSAKYWAEDMGRPYQPAETWPNYSYLNFLEKTAQASPEPDTGKLPMLNLLQKPSSRSRTYDFYWELWGLGSHRLLLWGDPGHVRRVVRTLTLSDTQGFEIDTPLAQKGFGNTETFGIFTPEQKERIFWRHEFERYWMFYTLWGRLSYDPETPHRAWTRELDERFGPAAADVLEAYQNASRVLNEIVAVHLADPNMYIWPEINPGGLIDAYKDVRPSDWAYVATVREAVHNRISGTASAKQTPLQTAAYLHALSNATNAALERARKQVPAGNREWLSTERDFQVLALLAQYHARKMMAADGLTAFYETGSDSGLLSARRQLGAALTDWKKIVGLTDGVYPPNMSFAPDDRGHWRDKLPYVEHDVTMLEERIELHKRLGPFDKGFDFGGAIGTPRGSSYRTEPYVIGNTVEPRFELVTPETVFTQKSGFGWVSNGAREAVTMPLASYHTVRAVARDPKDLPSNALFGDSIRGSGPQVFRVRTGAGKQTLRILRVDGSSVESETTPVNGYVDVSMPEGEWNIAGIVVKSTGASAAVQQRWTEQLPRPVIEHVAPAAAAPGKPLVLNVRVPSGGRVTSIRLRYRPLNQLDKFRTMDVAGARATFTIPAEDLSPNWDLMYYFEVLHDGNGGWFHPDPADSTPYFVVRVQ